MNENEILRSIDQYEILCELGRGGTSVVYLVTDRADGRSYAMKMLRKDEKPELYEQNANHLRAEASVLQALCSNEESTADSHPGIPAFIECICDGNGEFVGFVMEYVEGRSLQQIMEDGRSYTVREAAEAGLQLCSILEQLHGQNPPMIFRDLKPANILVRPDGHFVLVDYGAVRKLRKSAGSDTMRLGTDGYAAPEQYGGWEQSDERTDIYGIGAVLHHMVTGRPPLETGLRPLNEIRRLSGADRPRSEMSKILLRCCMTAPSMRYSSCGELEKALLGVLRLCAEGENRENNAGKKRRAGLRTGYGNARKKVVLLAGAASVFMVCSGFFAIASAGAEKMEYQRLIAEAARENDPVKMAERYGLAADVRPEDPEAYICLVRELVRDYVITQEEKELLESVLIGKDREKQMREKSPGNYAQLEMELGKAFFACYEGGAEEAGACFRKAREAAGIWFGGKKTAEAMEVVLGEEWRTDRITAWRVLVQESMREAEETGNGVFAAAVCKAAAAEISLHTDRYEKIGTEESAIREVTENAERLLSEVENGRVWVPECLCNELRTAVDAAARGEGRYERKAAEAPEKTQIGEAEQEHE